MLRQFASNLGGLQGAMAGVSGMALGLTTGLAALTSAAIAGAVAFGNQSEVIRRNAIVLGETTERVHAYQRAASAAGTDLDTVVNASLRINNVLQANKEKWNEVRQELLAYGIDARTAAELPILQQFELVARALAKIEDPGQRARAAVKLLGQEMATQLAPALLDTKVKWEDLVDSMQNKSSAFDPATTERVAAARREVQEFRDDLANLLYEMAAGILRGFDKDAPKLPVEWYLFLEDLREFKEASKDAFSDVEAPGLPEPPDPKFTIDEYKGMVKDAEADVRNSVLRTKAEWDALFDRIQQRSDELQPKGIRGPLTTPEVLILGPPVTTPQAGGVSEEAITRQSFAEIFTEAESLRLGLARISRVIAQENAAYVKEIARDTVEFTRYTAELTVRHWSDALLAGERWATRFEEVQKRLLQRLAAFALSTWVSFLGRLGFQALTAIVGAGAGPGTGAGSSIGTDVGGGVIVAGNIRAPRQDVLPELNLVVQMRSVFGTRAEITEISRILGQGLREAGVVR